MNSAWCAWNICCHIVFSLPVGPWSVGWTDVVLVWVQYSLTETEPRDMSLIQLAKISTN